MDLMEYLESNYNNYVLKINSDNVYNHITNLENFTMTDFENALIEFVNNRNVKQISLKLERWSNWFINLIVIILSFEFVSFDNTDNGVYWNMKRKRSE